MTSKPFASVSLDLDNLWSYQKTHGDPAWREFGTYLDRVADVVLPMLERLGWRITFFVVGQDAARPENRDALQRLVDAGHEIGNHSFHHEPWLHRYDRAALHLELQRAERALLEAVGMKPTTFRGPGYSCSNLLLEVLAERGYTLDASTLPTWLGPLARAYYFRTAKLTPEQRAERSRLFGSWRDALRPVKPYVWDLGKGAELSELPVSVLPLARVPFHPSYVLYLATYSPGLAKAYWRFALRGCRFCAVEPSVLLHPLDFLGADDVDALRFFPAMNVEGATKRARMASYFETLGQRFAIGTMSQHASRLKEQKKPLRPRLPDFPLGPASSPVDGA
ncbi:MAG: polysaccharide deacetylase family protein [Planctomycetota bacterium]